MKFHPYGNTDPFKMPEFADELLNEYWEIAENLGIKTFLMYGTCLGFIRDGGYIEGDNDIDVGILGGGKKLATGLIESGFICKGIWTVNAHFVKYNILLDVFFRPTYNISGDFFESFDEVKHNGRIYNVPHPIEKYLENRYGDWRTPNLREVWEG